MGTVGGNSAVPISSSGSSSAGSRCACPRPRESSQGGGNVGDGHPRVVEAAANATTAEPRRTAFRPGDGSFRHLGNSLLEQDGPLHSEGPSTAQSTACFLKIAVKGARQALRLTSPVAVGGQSAAANAQFSTGSQVARVLRAGKGLSRGQVQQPWTFCADVCAPTRWKAYV